MKSTSWIVAALCCILAISVCGAASAANVAWISFHADPNDLPSAAAASFGFAEAPDVGYTDLLRSAGHTVTRIQSVDNAAVSALNNYDLVILSRSVNSGHYEVDAETAAFNGLSVPLISMGAYPLRNNRMGYYAGTTIPDTTVPIKLTVNAPSNPIFAGISLDGTNTMVNDFAGIATLPHSPNTVQRGISVVTSPMVPGATVLATAPVGDPATQAPIIAFIPSGTPLATSPVDTLGGPRLVFLSGSREAANQMFPGQPSNTSSETAGIYDLSADGGRLFLNAVAIMAAIPEPSTATLLLFAFAGIGMLRKR